MGNCQAVEAAAMVIQHPNGKIERMYWSISAHEVMKLNPGYYVSLIIPISAHDNDDKKSVRYTRVKLLRPTDTLQLGHAYRLLSSQEVKRVLKAKQLAKTKTNEVGPQTDNLQTNQVNDREGKKLESEHNDQARRSERQRLRSGSMNSKLKTWKPSLNSISEAGT